MLLKLNFDVNLIILNVLEMVIVLFQIELLFFQSSPTPEGNVMSRYQEVYYLVLCELGICYMY